MSIHDKIAKDLEPVVGNGILVCNTCHRTQQPGKMGHYLATGWPECCGQTMELVTQRQIEAGYFGRHTT